MAGLQFDLFGFSSFDMYTKTTYCHLLLNPRQFYWRPVVDAIQLFLGGNIDFPKIKKLN